MQSNSTKTGAAPKLATNQTKAPTACPHCGHTKFTKTTRRGQTVWYCKGCTRSSEQPVKPAQPTAPAPELAQELATVPPEVIHAFELQQLSAYYRAAHPALRSLSWDLLQTEITPQNRPLLLATILGLLLVENEEARAYEQAQGGSETFPSVEESVAFFWRARTQGEDSLLLAQGTPETEREAITSAARALFALAPITTQEGK